MSDPFVVSFSAAAGLLGIDRQAVATLVKSVGIEPKPMVGKGKGLNRADIALLRTRLKRATTAERLAASASA